MEPMRNTEGAEGRFRQALGALIDSAGMSQKELAARAKVSRQTVFRVANGDMVPTIRVAHALAEALGTSIGALLDEKPRRAKTFSVGPSTTAVIPIVAKEVAAGEARIPLIDDLRHTFASDLVTAGIPEAWIRKAMGQRDDRSLRRYAKTRDEGLKAIAAALDRKLP